MIQSKEDLKYYLEQDALMLARPSKRFRIRHDELWRYQILLRKCEYLLNCRKDLFSRIRFRVLKFIMNRIARVRGFEIPFNVFGPGLSIAHYGPIIVNRNARIGKNCRIHESVTIGSTGFYSTDAPVIGDNVFLGTGAKIIGNVRIADNVVIGANAVVVKDILEPGTTWAGVPAKKVSDRDSSDYIAVPGKIPDGW